MIEAKLLVGRILDFPRAGSRHYPGGAHVPAFVDVVCPPLTINESTRESMNLFKPNVRHSTVTQGTNTGKMYRNFKWLPWYAGDISMTTLNADILTGPMSGCILTHFIHNGVLKVGHIGTVGVTASIPNTVNTNVKAVWNNFANAHPGSVLGGFSPIDNAVPPFPPAVGNDSGGEFWGLITTSGQYYSVQVRTQTTGITKYKVVGVHPVANMGLHALQNL